MDYKTENYFIDLGSNKEDGADIYQIINRETGVIEYDDFILPRTIEALLNLEEKLQEANRIYEHGESPSLSLVEEPTIVN